MDAGQEREPIRSLLRSAIDEDVNLQIKLADDLTDNEEKRCMLNGYPGNAALEPAILHFSRKEGQQLILRSMLREHGAMRLTIEPFDFYLHFLLPEIVREYSHVVVEAGLVRHEVLVGPDIRYSKPLMREPLGPDIQLSPNMCRTLHQTYQIMVYTSINYRVCRRSAEDADDWVVESQQCIPDFVLIEHPIMVGSSFAPPCDEDGGYFIIRGDKSNNISERSLQLVERLQTNYPFVFSTEPGAYDLEVRSVRESKIRSTSTLYVSMQQSNFTWSITFRLPFITCQIPLSHLLFAISVSPDELHTMLMLLGGPGRQDPHCKYAINCQLIRQVATLVDPGLFPDLPAMFNLIASKGCQDTQPHQRTDHMLHILSFEFLPHLGEDMSPTTCRYKAQFVALMLFRTLLVHLEGQRPDDRDRKHFVRDESSGHQIALLMRQAMRQWNKGIQVHIQKHVQDDSIPVNALVRSQPILNTNLRRAIITGNWTIKRNAKVQNGVTLPVNRQNLNATASFIRRCIKPINKEGKNAKPRMQPHDAWAIRCAAETPEGPAGGLINNVTLFAFPRLPHPSENILRFCYECAGVISFEEPGLDLADLATHPQARTVLVNGLLAGITLDPEQLMWQVRHRRRFQPGWIPRTASCFSRHGCVFINTDAGEMLRPVFVLENLPRFPGIWHRLCQRQTEAPWLGFYQAMLEEGCLEYLGPNESDHFRIAVKPQDVLAHPPGTFTHLEVHPYAMLGYSASLIAFLNYNQSPRIVLQAALGKQAIPQCPRNLAAQMGSGRYECIHGAETPLVQTLVEGISRTGDQGYGVNLFQVVATHQGDNVEDAIKFNRAIFDLGYYRTEVHRTYAENNVATGTNQVHFMRPTLGSCNKMRAANYSNIDEKHGCVLPGIRLGPTDMIIGRVVESKGQKNLGRAAQLLDRSVPVGRDDVGACVAEAVRITEGNTETLRVRTRKTMVPQVGDKFSSRHGQKGVAARLANPEDMPFIPELGGMIADIMMTPHAVTGRMTLGHMYELLFSMLCANYGVIGDGTGFQNFTVDEVMDLLQEAGLSPKGTYTAYDGITGEPYETKVYSGFVYIQRLKQLVEHKIHVRARGPVHPITKQPMDGRSKDGGFRMGEMEKDTLITHGAAFLVRDRMFEQSDHTLVPICRRCGVIASRPRRDLEIVKRSCPCHVCDKDDEIFEMEMPYPWKLLTQECMAMNCLYQLVFDKSSNVDPANSLIGLQLGTPPPPPPPPILE